MLPKHRNHYLLQTGVNTIASMGETVGDAEINKWEIEDIRNMQYTHRHNYTYDQ